MIVQQFTRIDDPKWDHHWVLDGRVHVIVFESANGKDAAWSAYVVDDLGREIATDHGLSDDVIQAEVEAKKSAVRLLVAHESPGSSEESPHSSAKESTNGNRDTSQRTGRAPKK